MKRRALVATMVALVCGVVYANLPADFEQLTAKMSRTDQGQFFRYKATLTGAAVFETYAWNLSVEADGTGNNLQTVAQGYVRADFDGHITLDILATVGVDNPPWTTMPPCRTHWHYRVRVYNPDDIVVFDTGVQKVTPDFN